MNCTADTAPLSFDSGLVGGGIIFKEPLLSREACACCWAAADSDSKPMTFVWPQVAARSDAVLPHMSLA